MPGRFIASKVDCHRFSFSAESMIEIFRAAGPLNFIPWSLKVGIGFIFSTINDSTLPSLKGRWVLAMTLLPLMRSKASPGEMDFNTFPSTTSFFNNSGRDLEFASGWRDILDARDGG